MSSQDYYFWLAVSCSALLLIKQLLLPWSSHDHDTFSEEHFSGLDPIMQFISTQSLLVFGLSIGWFGYIITQKNLFSSHVSLVIAVFFGLLMSFFSFFLLKQIKKLNSEPKKPLPSLGDIVETYTIIHPYGQGFGKVKYQTKERAEYYPAATEGGTIESFRAAVIVKVLEDGSLIIKQKE
jgi:hypothetical protein